MSLTVVVVIVVFFVCLFVNENCIPEALIQIHITIMGYPVVPVFFFEMFLQDTFLCSFLHSTRPKAAMVQGAPHEQFVSVHLSNVSGHPESSGTIDACAMPYKVMSLSH